MQEILNQAEIAESEGIQGRVNEAAVQVATAVMMALKMQMQDAYQPLLQAQESHRDTVNLLSKSCHSIGILRIGIMNYLTLRWKSQIYLKKRCMN